MSPTLQRRRVRVPSAFVLASALAACGSLGGDGGGGANLPNRGIVPYVRVDVRAAAEGSEAGAPDTEDALVLLDAEGRKLSEPSVLVVGSELEMYLAVTEGGASRIARTRSLDGVRWSPLEDVLTAEHVDGATSLGAPSVARRGSEALRMAVVVDGGASIAVAELGADGVTRVEVPALRAPDAASPLGGPSLVPLPEGGWALYFDRAAEPGAGRSIHRAASADGWVFDEAQPVLGPGADCTDAGGSSEPCWDRAGVYSAEVRVATTALGRTIYRMWYAAGDPASADLGFASSFDGVQWARFPYNPVLSARPAELGASNVMVGDRYLLFFEQRSRTRASGIALAINDEPAPSERF